MTPEQQHLKDHGHKYIGFVKTECLESYKTPRYSDREGSVSIMTAYSYFHYESLNLWDKYKPLFTPQEGEQFLKDLEEAVSAGCGKPCTVYSDKIENGNTIMFWCRNNIEVENDGSFFVVVKRQSLKILTSMSDITFFEASAYIDHLRSKGYYL